MRVHYSTVKDQDDLRLGKWLYGNKATEHVWKELKALSRSYK